MPPENEAGGPGLTPDPPHASPANKANHLKIVRDTPSQQQPDDAHRVYAAAYAVCRAGISQRARAAADLAATPVEAIQILGLARAALHAEVDFLVDLEVRRWQLARVPHPRDGRGA